MNVSFERSKRVGVGKPCKNNGTTRKYKERLNGGEALVQGWLKREATRVQDDLGKRWIYWRRAWRS